MHGTVKQWTFNFDLRATIQYEQRRIYNVKIDSTSVIVLPQWDQ